ncbi:MAG: ATP-binding protein, partial [Bacteroidales bacterium]|nr:ATP-binding protein [Bacteroidales bacterium]
RLKQTYDGYHFCWPSPDIYNPYSLLHALSNEKIDNYWFGTGTPTYLIEMLRKFNVTAVNIGGQRATVSTFDAPTEYMTNLVPLLYQSGYLTIKSRNSRTGSYLLDIPNKEIRVGLMDKLLPEYVTPAKEVEAHNVVEEIYLGVLDDKIEESLELVKKFLSSIPYTKNTKYEGHYQSLLYTIFGLVGEYDDIDVEPNTSGGNADMIIRTDTTIYIFETKMDGSAKEALEQIDIKNYPDRFAQYNLPIVKIGINFSTKTRTINDWVIER